MASSTQLKAFFFILCLSFGNATYSPLGRWVLTTANFANGYFTDLSGNGNNGVAKSVAFGSNAITDSVGCNSFRTAAPTSSFYYSNIKSSQSSDTEQGVSVWLNVDDISGQKPFSISVAKTENVHYYVTYGIGGAYSFYTKPNSGSDILVKTVNIGKEKWVFLVFHWLKSGSVWTWDIISPDFITITSTLSSNQYPGSYFRIGDLTYAYYYEIQFFKSAAVNSPIVTLQDSSGSTYVATSTCADSCSNYCYPTKGCLKTTCICPTLCTCSAGDDICTSCSDPTNTFANNSCKHKASYSLDGTSFFNRNLSTDFPDNCVIGTSKTVCTQCSSGYYLYDSGTSTTCLGNFYLACQTSCSICSTTSVCFKCIDSIIQDGNTCKTVSTGYQLSFTSPNIIVITFPHPLSDTLTIDNLKASTKTNQDIPTTTWKISSSSTPINYQIITDLVWTQLPINVDLSFNQGS